MQLLDAQRKLQTDLEQLKNRRDSYGKRERQHKN